ncbi:hypothetical protein [Nostoc sp. TCL240-02]|nr:hypothetical protein [Nostoc sp. TCL240-02]
MGFWGGNGCWGIEAIARATLILLAASCSVGGNGCWWVRAIAR